jgi:hypothetical protein
VRTNHLIKRTAMKAPRGKWRLPIYQESTGDPRDPHYQ